MTAPYVELYMDQGATFNHTITLIDDTINAAINIYGYTFESQMRKSYYTANASGNIVCTILDATNGIVSLAMTSANTANITPGRYVFDVKSTDTYSVRSRIMEGVIYVTHSVTR